MSKEISLLFVSDFLADCTNPLMDALARRYRCVQQSVKSFNEIRTGGGSSWTGIIFDADLTEARAVEQIKRGLFATDRSETFVVMIVDPYGHVDMKFALGMKSDRVIPRIVVDESAAFQSKQLKAVIDVARADFVKNGLDAIDWLVLKYSKPKTLTLALTAGETALDAIFQLTKPSNSISREDVDAGSRLIMKGLEDHGLTQWLDTVRQHHNATYRHSLAVTGVAAAFARALQFSTLDVERMMLSALLHDVGKAKVPVEILEKRTRLTEREEAILRQHPLDGRSMVAGQKGIDDDVLDAISQHHEFLDGSGYPHRLVGKDIRDMSRLLTISDCFTNLVTTQPNRDPVMPDGAFDHLCSMNSKLDMPLVKAFGGVVQQLTAR